MKKILLVAVLGLVMMGCEEAAHTVEISENMPSETMQQTPIQTQKVAYDPANPELMGYMAMPEGDGPFPAVVLIHEWWGMNENIEEFAQRFANEGYVALAVDLYNGESTTDRARAGELATAVRSNTEPAFANLAAAVKFLEQQSSVDPESLGAVGWCFGGGWAYQMAANDIGVDASVMYYGQFDAEADFQHMKTSILGHFGEEDRSISVDDVKVFRANLATTNGDHAVYIYPNAGHGFANGENPNYNAEAADLSWSRTLEFLQEEL